jgi:hypothetical protein
MNITWYAKDPARQSHAGNVTTQASATEYAAHHQAVDSHSKLSQLQFKRHRAAKQQQASSATRHHRSCIEPATNTHIALQTAQTHNQRCSLLTAAFTNGAQLPEILVRLPHAKLQHLTGHCKSQYSSSIAYTNCNTGWATAREYYYSSIVYTDCSSLLSMLAAPLTVTTQRSLAR